MKEIEKIVFSMAEKSFNPYETINLMSIREKAFNFLNLEKNIICFTDDNNDNIGISITLNNPFYHNQVILTLNENMLFNIYFVGLTKNKKIIRNVRSHLLTLSIREHIINSSINKN
jgi:hypothetical protein